MALWFILKDLRILTKDLILQLMLRYCFYNSAGKASTKPSHQNIIDDLVAKKWKILNYLEYLKTNR